MSLRESDLRSRTPSENRSVDDAVSMTGSVLTVDDCMDRTNFGLRQIRLLILSGMMLFLDAMTLVSVGHISTSLDTLWKPSYDELYTHYLTTSLFGGALFGAFLMGWVADHIGRRWGAIIGMLVMVVGTGLMLGSVNVYMIFIGTFIAGFGVSTVHIGQTLLAEFVAHKQRDLVVTGWAFFWSLGVIFTTFLTEIALPDVGQWRWFIVIILVPKLFLIASMYFWLPESPRWLVMHGQADRAKALLMEYAKSRGSKDNFPVYFEMKKITASKAPPLIKLVTEKSVRFVLLTVALLWFTLTGLYYSSVLSQKVSRIVTFTIALTECGSYVIQFFVGRWLGRRWGSIALLVPTIAIFLVFAFLKPITALLYVGRLVLSTSYYFLWLFSPEAFATANRSTCMGVCNSAGRLAGAIIPTLSTYLAAKTFDLIAVGLLAVGTIMAFFFLSETMQKPLRDQLGEDDQTDIEALAREELVAPLNEEQNNRDGGHGKKRTSSTGLPPVDARSPTDQNAAKSNDPNPSPSLVY